jgi:hypothetical protein
VLHVKHFSILTRFSLLLLCRFSHHRLLRQHDVRSYDGLEQQEASEVWLAARRAVWSEATRVRRFLLELSPSTSEAVVVMLWLTFDNAQV